ncbi:hypothetical protein QVD17_19972 [Tagetes erecta]|uniref:Uncharacterized protein n=1 Tax=Tagetes erecta TaxID=13708 RepID=A0AAD8NXP2_TARER|nr:hypothetical protein QVD17_19972 [Tagetes erecta]
MAGQLRSFYCNEYSVQVFSPFAMYPEVVPEYIEFEAVLQCLSNDLLDISFIHWFEMFVGMRLHGYEAHATVCHATTKYSSNRCFETCYEVDVVYVLCVGYEVAVVYGLCVGVFLKTPPRMDAVWSALKTPPIMEAMSAMSTIFGAVRIKSEAVNQTALNLTLLFDALAFRAGMKPL